MVTKNSIDSNIPIEVAKGGTNATSMANTDGVCYFDGTGVATTAVGTAGQILTSNGAAVAPTYQNPAWVKLASTSGSGGASIEFKSLISSTYKTYVAIIENLKTAAGSTLNMTISTDNGASYVATTYTSGNWYLSYNSATVNNQNTTSAFQLFTGADNTYGTSGTLWLYGFGYSAIPHIQGEFHVVNTYWQKAGGANTTAGTYNAIKFAFQAGNIDSGTITLYGIS